MVSNRKLAQHVTSDGNRLCYSCSISCRFIDRIVMRRHRAEIVGTNGGGAPDGDVMLISHLWTYEKRQLNYFTDCYGLSRCVAGGFDTYENIAGTAIHHVPSLIIITATWRLQIGIQQDKLSVTSFHADRSRQRRRLPAARRDPGAWSPFVRIYSSTRIKHAWMMASNRRAPIADLSTAADGSSPLDRHPLLPWAV